MPVPVYVHMGIADGVSCRGAKERSLKYRRDMSIYDEHKQLMDVLKPVLHEVYRLLPMEIQNITFSQLSSYADNILANKFEGVDMGYDFSERQMRAAFEVSKWALTEPLQHERETSEMYASRFLSRPFKLMNDIVNNKDVGGEKFFLFSGHDTNVANIWRYFRPVNFI